VKAYLVTLGHFIDTKAVLGVFSTEGIARSYVLLNYGMFMPNMDNSIWEDVDDNWIVIQEIEIDVECS